MTHPAPEAVFDTLVTAEVLTELNGGATSNEITLFCYLACLLSVYTDQPASAWGYNFAATTSVAPFSQDLSQALETAKATGLLVDKGAQVAISEAGAGEVAFLSRLERFRTRTRFLSAACNSTLAVPMPRVGAAVKAEPGLRRALELASTRELLNESGVRALHEHFRVLAEVVPAEADTFLAAVTWVSLLGATVAPDDNRDGLPDDVNGFTALPLRVSK